MVYMSLVAIEFNFTDSTETRLSFIKLPVFSQRNPIQPFQVVLSNFVAVGGNPTLVVSAMLLCVGYTPSFVVYGTTRSAVIMQPVAFGDTFVKLRDSFRCLAATAKLGCNFPQLNLEDISHKSHSECLGSYTLDRELNISCRQGCSSCIRQRDHIVHCKSQQMLSGAGLIVSCN